MKQHFGDEYEQRPHKQGPCADVSGAASWIPQSPISTWRSMWIRILGSVQSQRDSAHSYHFMVLYEAQWKRQIFSELRTLNSEQPLSSRCSKSKDQNLFDTQPWIGRTYLLSILQHQENQDREHIGCTDFVLTQHFRKPNPQYPQVACLFSSPLILFWDVSVHNCAFRTAFLQHAWSPGQLHSKMPAYSMRDLLDNSIPNCMLKACVISWNTEITLRKDFPFDIHSNS